MEAIHKASQRLWIDPNVINVKDFRDKFMTILPHIDEPSKTLKKLVSDDVYRQIEKDCSAETLRCPNQEQVDMSSNINVLCNPMLDTLKFQKEDLDKRKACPKYANSLYHNQKFTNYPPPEIIGPSTGIENIPFEPISTPDVMLNVQIYVPDRKVDYSTSPALAKMPVFQMDQEYLVLGCQYLTELRDKIECISDKAAPGEMSEYPTVEPTITCKEVYKSGFFYINGTFYNDMRDKDCRDYSEIIIKWSEEEDRKIGPFKKALMEKTRFIDLSIQLGYPYLYTHQGECEHLLVFSDLRMYGNFDVSNRNAYPLYASMKPLKRIFCMVCHAFTASWVVYDNDRLPENPFFFCKDCFISFNYDENNQKIGSFKAYHFPDRTKLA